MSDRIVDEIRRDAEFTAAKVGAPGSDIRLRAERTLKILGEWERYRAALRDISTLIIDECAAPSFTFSNLCEAVGTAKVALETSATKEPT